MITLASVVFWNSVLAAFLAGMVWSMSRLRAFTRRPALRHAAWLIVLLKLVTPPLVNVDVPISQAALWDGGISARPEQDEVTSQFPSPGLSFSQEMPTHQSSAEPVRSSSYESPEHLPVKTLSNTPQALSIAFLISGVGTCIIVVLVIRRASCIRRIIEHAEPASCELQRTASRIAVAMGISKALDVRVIDANLAPMLWASLYRPTVVVPKNVLSSLDPEQVSSVLAHEMAHYARRDHWTSCFATATLAVFWWHPIVWIVRRELRQTQEECCDAMVITSGTIQRKRYAETLLAVVDLQSQAERIDSIVCPGMGSSASFQRRFEMLGMNSVHPHLSRMAKLLLLSMVMCLPCVPSLVDGQQLSGETPRPDDTNTTGSRDAAILFESALEHISANYERLKTVELTFETISIDPSVDRREKKSGKTENGAVWSTTVAPVFIGRNTVRIAGDNLRRESYDRIGNVWNHVSTVVRKGDSWTTFIPASNWATRRSTDELGSLLPADPRDFGGLDQRYGLLEQMRRSKAISIDRSGGLIHIVAKMEDRPKYGYRPEQEFTYSFDPDMNLLPTRVIRHHDNGSINVVTELSYEEVVPGTSWFVREMTTKYFAEEVAATSSDSNAWHQLLVHKSVGPIRVNEQLDDDFSIDVPSDVRIR